MSRSAHLVERPCDHCGQAVRSYPSAQRRFCSRECEVAARTRPIPRDDIIRLYQAGATLSALEKSFGVDHRRLVPVLREAGVRIRKPGEIQQGRTRGPRVQRRPWSCPVCARTMMLSAAEQKGRTYCSQQCAGQARRGKAYWRKPRAARVAFVCPECGKTLMMLPSAAKVRRYCSASCANKNIGLKLTKAKPVLVCKACGHAFIRQGKGIRPQTYCSHACAMYDTHQRRRSGAARTLERLIGGLLRGMGVAYIPQWRFATMSADFHLPAFGCCIECDGDYWHKLPEAVKRDLKKEQAYKAAGIRVLHITESEATDDILGCQERILAFIAGTCATPIPT